VELKTKPQKRLVKSCDRIICIECKEGFWRGRKRQNPKGKARPIGVRASNCITCSAKCTKVRGRKNPLFKEKATSQKPLYKSEYSI